MKGRVFINDMIKQSCTLSAFIRGLRYGYKYVDMIGGFMCIRPTDLEGYWLIDVVPHDWDFKQNKTNAPYYVFWDDSKDYNDAKIIAMIKPLWHVRRVNRQIMFIIDEKGEYVRTRSHQKFQKTSA